MTHIPSALQVQRAALASFVHNNSSATRDVAVGLLIDLLRKTGEFQDADGYYEPDSAEHGVVDLFHAEGVTRVHLDGTVEQF